MKHLKITVDGKIYDVMVEELDEESVSENKTTTANISEKTNVNNSNLNDEPIVAPMSGSIVSVNVTNGQSVNKGDIIAVLEAMKMENEILAPKSGKIVAVNVNKGQNVDSNQVIAVIN